MTIPSPVQRILRVATIGAAGCFLLFLFASIFQVTDGIAVASTTSSTPRTYRTTFSNAENPISENGNWTNGASAGIDWSNVTTTRGLASGTQSGINADGESVALLTGTWSSDQSAEGQVHSVNQNDNISEEIGVVLRASLSAHSATGYQVKFRCLKTGAANVRIVRWNGSAGGTTVLSEVKGFEYGISEGDSVKATVKGNVIAAFINGTQVLRVTDGTYKSGNPGMSFSLQGTSGVNTDYGFASFTAADLSTTSASTQTASSVSTAASKSTTSTAASTSTTWKYSTNFPLTENPISEGGKWINGQTVGLDWANVQTKPGLAFGTESGDINYDDSTALLTGTWGPDQTAQATVHTVNQNDNVWEEVEFRLRSSISAHLNTGYEINFRCSKTSNAYAQIVRWNGRLGNFTFLQTKNGAAYGVANGDVVKASIVGNVITAWINGVQILQVTDNTYSSGKPGMGFYLKGHAPLSDYGFTNFMATEGSTTSSGPSPPSNLSASPH